MMHWDWFVMFAFGVAIYGWATIKLRLDRIIRLLEVATEQLGESGASLRAIDHNSKVLREHTPKR